MNIERPTSNVERQRASQGETISVIRVISGLQSRRAEATTLGTSL
jgi:hypothetical protein